MTDMLPIYGGFPYGTAHYAAERKSGGVVGRGPLAVSTAFWLADRDGNKLERLPLTDPTGGGIEYNEDISISRRLRLDVNEPLRLAPLQDYIIPELTIVDAGGNVTSRTMGHFIITPPNTSLTATRFSGTITADDVSWLLTVDRFSEFFTIPAGTDSGSAAREIALATMGASQVNLPNTGYPLRSDMPVSAGQSRMEVITELYAVANWYKPRINGQGVLSTVPAIDLATAKPSRHWSTASDRVTIVPPVTETPEWARLRNRVTVRNIRPDQEPIHYTADVENVDSPVHMNNIGGDPTRPLILAGDPVDDPQIETEDEARARAEILLADGASWYRRLAVQSLPDLDAGAHDVIGLDIDHMGARYEGNWIRRAWSIDLSGIVATMQSELTRIEPWR